MLELMLDLVSAIARQDGRADAGPSTVRGSPAPTAAAVAQGDDQRASASPIFVQLPHVMVEFGLHNGVSVVPLDTAVIPMGRELAPQRPSATATPNPRERQLEMNDQPAPRPCAIAQVRGLSRSI